MEKAKYNRIQAVLEEKGKTVYWLQEQLGETIPNVVRWSKNISQPSIEILFEIAKILDVDVQQLLVSSTGGGLCPSINTCNNRIIVNGKNYNIQNDNRLLIPFIHENSNLIGFINKRGHIRIACSYNSVYDDFYSVDDVIRVGSWAVTGDKHFFKSVIKTDGKDLFKESFKDIIMSEDRQRFVVENFKGEWAVLNREKKEIVPYGRYDWIDGYKNGFARVKQGKITNGKRLGEKLWGIIDSEGNEILPIVFPNIHAFLKDSKGYITLEFFNEEEVESIITEGFFQPLPCPSRFKRVSFDDLSSANIGMQIVKEMQIEKEKYKKRIEEYNKALPESRLLFKKNLYNKPDFAPSGYFDHNEAAREQIADAYEGKPDALWDTD